MAAAGDEDNSGWWGGWIQSAKEKSAGAFKQIKKDLGEFGNTIQKDTSSMVATSAGVMRDSLQTGSGSIESSSTGSRVKQTFSDLLSGLSESLTPKESNRDEELRSSSSKSSHHIFDRAKARLHAMQIDAGTYCTDPEGPHDAYEDWLQSFDTDKYKGNISDLLVANTDVRAIYTKLVPAVVSNADFWGRYFYKVHQLNQDEARRAALKERADMTSSQTFDQEELQWDDDEEDSADIPVIQEKTDIAGHAADEQDRITNVPTSDQPEDIGSTECDHGNNDDPLTAIETLPEQSPDFNTSHDCLNTEADTEPAKMEDSQPGTTTPCEETDSVPVPVPEALEANVSGGSQTSQDEQSTERHSPTDKEIDDKCHEDKDTKGHGEVEDRLTETDTSMTHAPSQQVQCDEPADKKTSPSGSDTSNKDSSLSDDWEQDFDDIEVTEEDIAATAMKAKTSLNGSDDEDLDDWENWE